MPQKLKAKSAINQLNQHAIGAGGRDAQAHNQAIDTFKAAAESSRHAALSLRQKRPASRREAARPWRTPQAKSGLRNSKADVARQDLRAWPWNGQ